MLKIILIILLSCSTKADKWDPVRKALDKFPLISDMVFSIGDSNGNLMRYVKGKKTTFDTKMEVASSSKWVSATAILNVVHEGKLSLDTKASDVLPYWTKDS